MYISNFSAILNAFLEELQNDRDDEDFDFLVNNFFDNSVYELCCSVLNGEYVKDIEKTWDELLSLKIRLQQIRGFNEDPLRFQKLFNIHICIDDCLSLYLTVLKEFKNLFTIYKQDYYLSDNLYFNQENFKSNPILTCYLYILKISDFDILQRSSFVHFKVLIYVRNLVNSIEFISTSRFGKLKKIILTKIEFLIFKTAERLSLIDSNFELKKIELGFEINFDEFTTLKTWKNKIDFHYKETIPTKKYKNNYSEVIKSFSEEVKKDTNTLNIHTLIKWYKDHTKSFEKLWFIVICMEMKRRDQCILSRYNSYCSEINLNFAINNYFSLYCENSNIDLDVLVNEFEKCKSKSSDLVRNYWLPFKFINKATEIISLQLNKFDGHKNLLKLFNKYDEFINNYCEDILLEYQHSIYWALKNSHYVFALPYDEILQTFEMDNREKLEVVFFSSFVLPVDNEKVKADFEKTKQKHRELKATLGVIKSLQSELKTLEHLNTEYDKRDKKTLETLGIFTAIFSVIISSVVSLKFLEDLYGALLFFMAFSASIGFFLMGLFVMLDKRRVNHSMTMFLFVFIFICAMISWSILLRNA